MKSKRMVRILSLVVVLSMILTTAAFAAPQNKRFEHFDKKYEIKLEDYENALKALIDKEIVKGYGNGDYGLSGNVKRGDVIVMIIRMLEEYEKINVDVDDIKEAFEDVYRYEYFYESVAKAKKLGIAKGDGKLFNPNKPVTVQETIWLIERAGNELGLDVSDGIVEDLEGIYEDELNKFAKRRDVFWMLYYVLDLVEYDEPEDDEEDNEDYDITIEYTLEADEEFLDFDADDFIDALEDENEEALKYIMFKSGNEKLHYDYYNDDDIIVNRTNKYFVTGEKGREISKITYVREDESSRELEIEYLSYYNDDGDIVSIPGLIKIYVEGEETVDDVVYTMIENTELRFKEKDFNKSIDSVKFDVSSLDNGDLFYSTGTNSFKKITDENKIYNDEELSKIIYKPDEGHNGIEILKYTANIDNKTYLGKVVINVLDKVDVEDIDGIEVMKYGEITINFRNTLDEELADSIIDKIDYVKLENPDEGTLWISDKKVDSNIQYKITDLRAMVYEAEGEGLVDVDYVAVDLDNFKAYIGTIEIYVED